MRYSRRGFLGCLPPAAVVVAGCLDGPSGSDGGENDDEAATADPDDGTDADGDDHGPPESNYGLTVERADTRTVLERFDVAILADQSSTVRDAVREAIAGRYETDSVDDALTSFVTEYEFVRDDETYYFVDARLPREVLTLSPVDRDGIDETAIVGADTFREDVSAADAVTTAIAHGEAKRPTFSGFLHDLVETYEYVTPTEPDDEDADVYEWTIETDDGGGPPYWLDATAAESTDVFGDDVVDVESLSADAREEIEAARERGRITFDSQPAVLGDGPVHYVRIDGAFYSIAVDVAD